MDFIHAPSKRHLRAEFRARRQAMSQEEFEERNAQILAQLLALPEVERAYTIFSYVAFGREVDTRQALRALLLRGKRILTPVSARSLDPQLCYHLVTAGDPLLDPHAETPPEASRDRCYPVRSDEIDLFLVPALAWDEEGYRLGFGGGFFDKLLARARGDACKLGLGFDFQLVERLPHDPWDIAVDLVVTDQRRLALG